MGLSKKVLGVIAGVVMTAACSPQNKAAFQSTDSASNIIGGTAVSAQDPISFSTVQILHMTLQKDAQGRTMIKGLSTCTGTVMTNDVILTAGHCSAKDPGSLLVLFSDQIPNWKQFFATLSKNPMVRRVTGGVTAPNWAKLSNDTDVNWGDLSLLRFSGGLPQGYVPATLVPASAQLKAGMPVTLAGFGETDGVKQTPATELMKVTVNIADPAFSDTEIKIDNTNGTGACHGDSGGPAYVTSNGVNYLVGVTSRADVATDPKAVCVGKTIYTKVAPYLPWISSEIQNLEGSASYGTTIAEPDGFDQ
ncbi:MAG TPA: trypsin-like serine protease [Bdellovibrio sp.]|uniref:S1 family peptidase n=1 Tax=Bdellovibrio sp. TaxID=28201 RepID=UPI002F238674